jgi:hypothetical protein
MDTAVRPPSAPPAAAATAPRRPRWLRWIVVVLALAVAGSVVGGWAWIARYQPVTQGSSGFHIRTPIRQRVVDISPVGGPAHTLVHLWVRPGDRFEHLVSIRNEGRLAVTIEWVGQRSGAGPENMFTETPVGMQLDLDSFGAEESQAFQPFTLGPGAEAVVVIRIDAVGCRLRHGSAVWRDVDVEFSVLGVHREASLPMQEVIVMHGIYAC